jgi:hypothetical protein
MLIKLKFFQVGLIFMLVVSLLLKDNCLELDIL